MTWLPFPFPQCPSCGDSWTTSKHRDCRRHGELELDPDARRVQCDSCHDQWGVHDSQFYCLCGHRFAAGEVDAALREVVRAASLLARIVEQHRADLKEIQLAGQHSVRSWFDRIAQGIGGALGHALGSIAGSVVRMLFGST